MNYYNEHDENAAVWLRNLANQGSIPHGKVDCRDIKEVKADELNKFTQCHFFAGISGWSLALEIAGIPADFPVWTGSCPCQPFSSAGNRKGKDDDRHLWPAFFNLIRECRPQLVFGEQVESAIRHGWIDDLQADVEAEGYACGYTVLGAHSIGAPHKRQRLFWGIVLRDRISELAKSNGTELQQIACTGEQPLHEQSGGIVDLADINHTRHEGRTIEPTRKEQQTTERSSGIIQLANGDSQRFSRRSKQDSGSLLDEICASRRIDASRCGGHDEPAGPSITVAYCRDGKFRPISPKPGDEPLAYGIPIGMGRGEPKQRRVAIRAARTNRTTRLRGYGNAIVPAVAAEFVIAFFQSLLDLQE